MKISCAENCLSFRTGQNKRYSVEVLLTIDESGKIFNEIGELVELVQKMLRNPTSHLRCGWCGGPIKLEEK